MSKQYRLGGIIGSAGIAAFFGWQMFLELKQDCSSLSKPECHFLWGTVIVSVLGGALFLEIFIAHKKARGEWWAQTQKPQSDGSSIPTSWLWYRSVARVILVSLLSGLPLIAKGTLVLAGAGVFTGLCLDLLIRYAMNWLPPVEKDTET